MKKPKWLPRVRLYFDPRDLWIGVFWRRKSLSCQPFITFFADEVLEIFICLLPCLPLALAWRVKNKMWAKACRQMEDLRKGRSRFGLTRLGPEDVRIVSDPPITTVTFERPARPQPPPPPPLKKE